MMLDADISEIRSIHLFKNVAEAHFRALIAAAYLQRFPAQVTLIEECQSSDFLHVVIEGSVELFSRHDGRETTISIVRPIATFILAAVVSERPYLSSGRTLEPSRILMIPAEPVRGVFYQDSAFARAIVRELAGAFRGVVKEIKNHKLRTGIERLANSLLRMNMRFGGTGRFAIPYDRRTLASRLGMTPENLSRNLATLSEYGVVVRGRDVTLKNIAALTAVAKPKPSIDDPAY